MTKLFIFRRDLRLIDNIGLNACIKNANKDNEDVAVMFIFTPQQIDKNPYKSENCIQFMVDCLKELNSDLNGQLNFAYGNCSDVVQSVVQNIGQNNIQDGISEVYGNFDYTPFAKTRDMEIINKLPVGIKMKLYHDYKLKHGVVNQSGENYSVYTPYMREALSRIKKDGIKVENMSKPKKKFIKLNIPKEYEMTNERWKKVTFDNKKIHRPFDKPFGRKSALWILNNLDKLIPNYKTSREVPSIEGTSFLSPYNKFGCVSPREIYIASMKKLKGEHRDGFIGQLIWRDFYYTIAEWNPRVLNGGLKNEPLKKKMLKWKWSNDKELFKAWCEGRTGYPLVDAGMKQLNTTGYMHNRVRMTVSSFLVKNLNIDWRWGEQYFATRLIDYDPAVNSGNWQYMSAVGADAYMYTQVMSPIAQMKRFDKKAEYVKKWLPILKDIDAKDIIELKITGVNYPTPIVDFDKSRQEYITRYKKL